MLRRVKLLANKLNQKYLMLLKEKKCSDDTRKKMSAAQSTSQAIEVTDLQEKTMTSYNSINEAARVLNIPKSVIDKYFSRNQTKPYKDKYTFNKIDS